MRLKSTRPQMSGEQLELPFGRKGEAHESERSEEGPTATRGLGHSEAKGDLMERIVERSNLGAALKRVKSNKGSPGIDGMTVGELSAYLKEHWVRIREELLAGTYQPQMVKRVEIPKAGGGVRELGIPTVLDRFIQQAMLQVLQEEWDKTFSQYSYGFRPGKSAHQAVRQAQAYVQAGRRWVVDVDLEKFFDRVNHDVLMGRLAKRTTDRRVLAIVRRYLEAGVMADGILLERFEGTPQGGPLSPLLANVLLDEVDKELERRGHTFIRYADDANVYMRSRRAGERVMLLLRRLFTGLHLRINEAKSAVAPVRYRKVLGYSFWYAKGGTVKLRVAPKALKAMKDRVREITTRNGGRSLKQVVGELREYLTGWRLYFQLAETSRIFSDLDEWIRHRLRAIQLKHWKRGTTIYRALRARGMSHRVAAQVAAHGHQWWKTSDKALNPVLPTRFFDQLQLPRLGP